MRGFVPFTPCAWFFCCLTKPFGGTVRFCYSFSFKRKKKTVFILKSCLSARSFIIFWVNNYEVIKKWLKTSLAASFSFHSFLFFLGGIRKGERITSMYCKIIHSYTTGNKETCIKNLYNLLHV